MKLHLSIEAEYVISHLEASGFEAFAVGGCVRDMFMGLEPDDWDVATNALPEQVKSVFKRTFDTGIKHGTITVLTPNDQVEVTTYRSEGEYLDNRRPSQVKFENEISSDLSRRDFTINAMAFNPKVGLIDPFGGFADINNGIIRCVGNADERFREDALRMLRAVRFACRTGFEIEEKTFESIKNNAVLICNISAERIRDELCKALLSANPSRLILLHQTGLDSHIMPDLRECFLTEQHHPYHLYNVGEHILKVVENTPKDLEVRLSALLHDIGKPKAKTTDEKGIDHFRGHGDISAKLAHLILRGLRLDNLTISNVVKLVLVHDTLIDGSPLCVRKVAAKVGDDLFLKLIALQRADCMGQNPIKTQSKLKHLQESEEYYKNHRHEMVLKISELAVNGADLIEVGVKQGPEVGYVLDTLLKAVIKKPELNSRDTLLKMALGIKLQ